MAAMVGLAACSSQLEPQTPASTVAMIAERPIEDGVEVVQTIQPRPGVAERFLLSRPRHPKAAVVLLPGGGGVLNIDLAGGLGKGKSNFLVRSRRLFERAGLIVATVDAPSDHQGPKGMRGGFRGTETHARDIGAVIQYLHSRFGKPVWLVGTSRSTISTVNAAIRLKGAGAMAPDGLVLTATVTKGAKTGLQVMRFDLPSITQPVLIAHHQQDSCRVSPFSRAEDVKRRLKRAARVEILAYSGGFSDGDACQGRSHHGFRGIEPEVVSEIADWIGKNTG